MKGGSGRKASEIFFAAPAKLFLTPSLIRKVYSLYNSYITLHWTEGGSDKIWDSENFWSQPTTGAPPDTPLMLTTDILPNQLIGLRKA